MGEEAGHKQIRLLLLDDHGLFRASLARFLAGEPGIEIAGECATGVEALEVLNRSTVDIALLDFDLGPEHGNEFISAARQAGYQGNFLVVAGTADAKSAAIALKLGASGIFLKSEAPERLVQAIRLIADGEIWVDPKVIQMLAYQLADSYPQLDHQVSDAVLDDRERKVLLGVLGGLTNKKIGINLGLSESSVKNVMQRLFGKTGVKKRSQLVRVALEGSLGMARDVMRRQLKEASVGDRSRQNRPRRSRNLSSAKQSRG